VAPERFRLEWCSSAEAQRFVDVVTGMTETVRDLGPLGSEGGKGEELKKSLTAARDATTSERLRWFVGKEYSLETEPNVFGEEYPQEAFKELLETAVRDEYYKARIVNLTREKPRSVKEMAPELRLDAAEVLRLVTTLRGHNVVDVKEVKGTSPLYGALV
jgi:hypothetical protein